MATEKIEAILSSTVLTNDGTYSVKTVPFPPDLTGLTHYVGHPATKGLIETLGAIPSSSKLFGGLDVGQSYLAVPLANNQREAGYTQNEAISDISQLTAKLVTRIA